MTFSSELKLISELTHKHLEGDAPGSGLWFPAFFLEVLTDAKLSSAKIFDEELIKKYPNFIEFNREIKDFFWSGIYARPDMEK